MIVENEAKWTLKESTTLTSSEIIPQALLAGSKTRRRSVRKRRLSLDVSLDELKVCALLRKLICVHWQVDFPLSRLINSLLHYHPTSRLPLNQHPTRSLLNRNHHRTDNFPNDWLYDNLSRLLIYPSNWRIWHAYVYRIRSDTGNESAGSSWAATRAT